METGRLPEAFIREDAVIDLRKEREGGGEWEGVMR